MKKTLSRSIEIPKGVSVTFDGKNIKVTGPEGEISRDLNPWKLKIEVKDNKIILGYNNSTKNEKKIINTFYSHIKNMIKGVQKKFEYHLKVCYVHFPFTLKHEGKKVMIKNFLGEKIERVVLIPDGVDIEIKKDIIIVKSADKELAGQASANFETATKVRGRDKRTFQDGIYIIEKGGKKL